MRFDDRFLDEIRARLPISQVIGRAVSWDRRKTNAGRGDYWACCPFHNEKTPSFHCQDSKGRYHCFGCKASGDIFTFLVNKEGLSFPEAVERLAGEAGVAMPKRDGREQERADAREGLYAAMELAASWFAEQLSSPAGSQARAALAERGVGDGTVREFAIGYAPGDRHGLKTYLAGKGVSGEQMAACGLVVAGDDIAVPFDRFRERIMFPIADRRGRVIAFGGRALSDQARAKYLNSPEGPLFEKRKVLYNLHRARRFAHEAQSVIAVEGYMDVIALHRAGIGHAVAPLGTAVSEWQLEEMWRLASEPVMCFDGDEAGLKAAYRALDLALPMLAPGRSLKFVLLPPGVDPDDIVRTGGAKDLQQCIDSAESLVDVLWRRALDENRRDTPEARAKFEAEIAAAVGRIADARVRAHYKDELRQRVRRLWDKGKSRRWQQARGGRGRGGRAWAGRGGREPWREERPVSAELKALSGRQSPQGPGERRERLVVLAMINHPDLVVAHTELFSGLEFTSVELDSLRREIIDVAALSEDLETHVVRDHLINTGRAGMVNMLERHARGLGSWFVEAGAAPRDVLTGVRQIVTLHRKWVTLRRELTIAEEALAEHGSEDALKRLNDIREELLSVSGQEAMVEGFGEASGRTAPQAS